MCHGRTDSKKDLVSAVIAAVGDKASQSRVRWQRAPTNRQRREMSSRLARHSRIRMPCRSQCLKCTGRVPAETLSTNAASNAIVSAPMARTFRSLKRSTSSSFIPGALQAYHWACALPPMLLWSPEVHECDLVRANGDTMLAFHRFNIETREHVTGFPVAIGAVVGNGLCH